MEVRVLSPARALRARRLWFLRAGLSVVTVVALLAGCGGGDPSKTTTTTAAATTATTAPSYAFPPATVAVRASDQETAGRISLRFVDIPTEWVLGAREGTSIPRDADLDEAMVNCSFGPTPSPLTAYFVSAVYQSRDGRTLARSFVRVVRSQREAQADFTAFKAQRISECQVAMYQRFRDLAAAGNNDIYGNKYGDAAPGLLPVEFATPPDGSKDVISYRMVITPSDATPVHQNIFAYGAGRYETILLVASDGAIDPEIEKQLLAGLKIRTLEAARLG